MAPFSYPHTPHVRRHGPSGYTDYSSYRPWLRDEFTFRCVYCLKREQWGIVRGTYHLDHFLPQAHNPASSVDYDNLLYACGSCSSAKRDLTVSNPSECMLEPFVIVREDGTIESTNPDAEKVIRVLGLDDPEYREFRRLWIDILAMSRLHRPELYRRLMTFPDDLPDLATLRPSGNSRPGGVQESWKARRDRGELPDTY